MKRENHIFSTEIQTTTNHTDQNESYKRQWLSVTRITLPFLAGHKVSLGQNVTAIIIERFVLSCDLFELKNDGYLCDACFSTCARVYDTWWASFDGIWIYLPPFFSFLYTMFLIRSDPCCMLCLIGFFSPFVQILRFNGNMVMLSQTVYWRLCSSGNFKRINLYLRDKDDSKRLEKPLNNGVE